MLSLTMSLTTRKLSGVVNYSGCYPQETTSSPKLPAKTPLERSLVLTFEGVHWRLFKMLQKTITTLFIVYNSVLANTRKERFMHMSCQAKASFTDVITNSINTNNLWLHVAAFQPSTRESSFWFIPFFFFFFFFFQTAYMLCSILYFTVLVLIPELCTLIWT